VKNYLLTEVGGFETEKSLRLGRLEMICVDPAPVEGAVPAMYNTAVEYWMGQGFVMERAFGPLGSSVVETWGSR
jgi:hypothetical protein